MKIAEEAGAGPDIRRSRTRDKEKTKSIQVSLFYLKKIR